MPTARARNGFGLLSTDVVRIAEVPGQAVEVAEDVAAAHDASPLLDVELGVVEERPAVDDARRAPGCGAAGGRSRCAVAGVDHRDRVVEARAARRAGCAASSSDEPARAAAGHGDVIRRVRREGVGLELRRCRTRRPCSSRRRRRRASRRRSSPPCRSASPGSSPCRAGGARARRGVVDVLVQVARQHARAVEHGDARLVQVSAHGGAAEDRRDPRSAPRCAPRCW